MPTAQQLTDPDATHGEGPVWWPGWGGLRWVDMLAGDVLHLDSAGRVARWHVGTVAAAIRPRSNGGLVAATEHDFVLADQLDGPVRVLAQAFSDPAVRFNDGGCDPAGNFWCGSMAYDETAGAGSLYRVSADGDVTTVLTGVTVSNGLAWNAVGDRCFYADTPTGRVDIFDSDREGTLTNRRPFIVFDPSDGSPDGLCVDAADGIWVAMWNGSGVRHFDAQGRLTEFVELPTSKVTACTLGGPDLSTLFITTSRVADPDERVRGAGALFTHPVDQPGFPVALFEG